MVKIPPRFQTMWQWLFFLFCVVLGVLLLQLFVFRMYNVVGPSMETTLFTGNFLLINKLPRTFAHITNKPFLPERGDIVVFKNPLFETGSSDEYVIKRVIGLPGDRVVVKDGSVTIYNQETPQGFNPDTSLPTIQQPTSGNVDRAVPENEVFVAGDNRIGRYSLDSRNGMSTIPERELEGVVAMRLLPLNKIRLF